VSHVGHDRGRGHAVPAPGAAELVVHVEGEAAGAPAAGRQLGGGVGGARGRIPPLVDLGPMLSFLKIFSMDKIGEKNGIFAQSNAV
jgi:hypothetical protein